MGLVPNAFPFLQVSVSVSVVIVGSKPRGHVRRTRKDPTKLSLDW
jgi:hypothetical protein